MVHAPDRVSFLAVDSIKSPLCTKKSLVNHRDKVCCRYTEHGIVRSIIGSKIQGRVFVFPHTPLPQRRAHVPAVIKHVGRH